MKNKIFHCENLTDSNPILKKYCNASLKFLIEHNNICTQYKKGQVIFYEDQLVTGIYFINSGKVKLWKEGIHGREQIVRFSKDGDIMGYRGCLEDTKYALSATILEDSIICFIEKDIFFKFLKDNSELHFNLLFYYTKELRKIESRLRDMAEMNVREKVAEALLIIKKAFGMEPSDNMTMNVQLARQDIASIAGISTDQTIKQLAQFKEEKLIDTEGKKIKILNQKGLQGIIASYNFEQAL